MSINIETQKENKSYILDVTKDNIKLQLPITVARGKIRVKQTLGTNSIPFKTRQDIIDENCFLEWQISYDKEVSNEIKDNFINLHYENPKLTFFDYKNTEKYIYELGEIIYLALINNMVSKNQLDHLYQTIKENQTLICNHTQIKSTPSLENMIINNLELSKTKIEYEKFSFQLDKDIVIKIHTKEREQGVGLQQMLYLCIPLHRCETDCLGRIANVQEKVYFNINKENIEIMLNTFSLLSSLSERHKIDCQNILEVILNNEK